MEGTGKKETTLMPPYVPMDFISSQRNTVRSIPLVDLCALWRPDDCSGALINGHNSQCLANMAIKTSPIQPHVPPVVIRDQER